MLIFILLILSFDNNFLREVFIFISAKLDNNPGFLSTKICKSLLHILKIIIYTYSKRQDICIKCSIYVLSAITNYYDLQTCDFSFSILFN